MHVTFGYLSRPSQFIKLFQAFIAVGEPGQGAFKSQ